MSVQTTGTDQPMSVQTTGNDQPMAVQTTGNDEPMTVQTTGTYQPMSVRAVGTQSGRWPEQGMDTVDKLLVGGALAQNCCAVGMFTRIGICERREGKKEPHGGHKSRTPHTQAEKKTCRPERKLVF